MKIEINNKRMEIIVLILILGFAVVMSGGDGKAEYEKGIAYFNGEGVEQNDKQAVAWFHKSAGQDDATAKHNLAVLHKESRDPFLLYELNLDEADRAIETQQPSGRSVPNGRLLSKALFYQNSVPMPVVHYDKEDGEVIL